MIQLLASRGLRRALCIGAHCDDIEIGCGGALLQLQKTAEDIIIDWIVLTGEPERQAETRIARELLLAPAHRGELEFGGFPDSRLPAEYGQLKNYFAGLARRLDPDLVFCHERHDEHQDHRIVNEMVWGAFRDHLILEYEIIKWDGGLRTPNVYLPLDADVVERKVEVLMQAYGTQRSKDWFTPQTFRAVSRIRGVECRATSGHAEGFTARKLIMPFCGR